MTYSVSDCHILGWSESLSLSLSQYLRLQSGVQIILTFSLMRNIFSFLTLCQHFWMDANVWIFPLWNERGPHSLSFNSDCQARLHIYTSEWYWAGVISYTIAENRSPNGFISQIPTYPLAWPCDWCWLQSWRVAQWRKLRRQMWALSVIETNKHSSQRPNIYHNCVDSEEEDHCNDYS